MLWAALWLGSAALWLLPVNRSNDGVRDAIAGAPSGTGWLSSVHASVAAAAAGHGTEIAVGAAGLSAMIGLGALLDHWMKPLLVLATGIALAYFVLGQGMGGVLTGTGTDPGTGPLLVLLAAAANGAVARTKAPEPPPAREVLAVQSHRGPREVLREAARSTHAAGSL